MLARVANKPDKMKNSLAGVVSMDDQLGALLGELEAHGSLVRPLSCRGHRAQQRLILILAA